MQLRSGFENGGLVQLWLFLLRFRSLLLLGLIAAGASAASAQTAVVHGLFYKQEFVQVGDFVFTNSPSTLPTWEGWARGYEKGALKQARVSSAQGIPTNLAIDDEGASGGGLAMLFPPGSCSMNVTRADGSVFTTAWTLAAAAYPAPPRFVNLLSVEAKAGQNLALTIQPGADARADDYLFVSVQGFNVETGAGWQFLTPWPAQLNALGGQATAVTIPGDVMKPGDQMQLRLFCYRPTFRQSNATSLALAGSAAGVMTTLTVAAAPTNSDVVSFRLMPLQAFVQNGDQNPTPMISGGFAFEAMALARESGRLAKVDLTVASGRTLDVPSNDQQLWITNLTFSSETEMTAATGLGNCAWRFDGIAQTGRTAVAQLSAGAFPSPIQITNWPSLQTNTFANGLALRWSAPAGASSSDRVELNVVSPSGKSILRLPDYAGGGGPISGSVTQLIIPGGKLTDGDDYEARLRYVHVLAQDMTSIDGAAGIVARASETRFPIGTLVALPVAILTTNFPNAVVGEDYFRQLTGNGGRRPYAWSLASGSLPLGLALQPNGAIEGIPAQNGIFNFTVTVTDALGQRASESFRLEVTGTLLPLTLKTQTLPPLYPRLFYVAELEIAGGAPPYQWELVSGRLPNGMELNTCCGRIIGLPRESGSFSFGLRVRDAAGQLQERAYALDVPAEVLEPPLRITGWSHRGDGHVSVNVTGDEADPITIESSEDLNLWVTAAATNLSSTRTIEVTAANQSHRFFRARVGHDSAAPDPLLVNPNVSGSNFVEGLLYTNGLTLRLTNSAGFVIELALPTNAVTLPTRIKMSLVHSLTNMPLDSLLWAVELKPEGLYLLKPGTLTVTYPPGATLKPLSFGYGSQGRDFHLAPAFQQTARVVMPILHFSGAGQGSGPDNYVPKHPPCLAMSQFEEQISEIQRASYPDSADPAILRPIMEKWFNQSVFPHLKQAETDDSKLDQTAKEYVWWETVGALLGTSSGWNEKGLSSLALGYANAINRADSRCSSNFNPGESFVMLRRAKEAMTLGLDAYLPGGFLSDAFERMGRCLRFEMKIESIIDLTGEWVEQVRSSYLKFKWNESNIGEGGIYLAPDGNAQLELVNWDVRNDEGRTRPNIAPGSFKGIWLKLSGDQGEQDPPDPLNPCREQPPADYLPEVSCFFQVEEPLDGLWVQSVDGKWYFESLPVDAGGRWGSAFKLAHYDEWKGLPDLGGGEATGYLFEDWEVAGERIFATKEYTGTFEMSQGKATETTYIELRHAPKPKGK